MTLNALNIFQNISDVYDYPDGAKLLRKLHLDDVHLDPNIVASMGWTAIHAENDGHLEEDEEDILSEHFQKSKSLAFYATTLKNISKEEEEKKFRSVILLNVTKDILRTLQEGTISTPQPENQEDAYLSADITFYASTSFDRPLSFVMLREAEGYGWTTIAGLPSLISSIKNQSLHQIYSWQDGVLPLHIAGSSDPKRR